MFVSNFFPAPDNRGCPGVVVVIVVVVVMMGWTELTGTLMYFFICASTDVGLLCDV